MATRLHHRVWTALRSFIGHRAAERELDDELRFHFEQMHAYEAARAANRRRVPRTTSICGRGGGLVDSIR